MEHFYLSYQPLLAAKEDFADDRVSPYASLETVPQFLEPSRYARRSPGVARLRGWLWGSVRSFELSSSSFGASLFSLGIWWSGLILNRCGCEVQALQTNSYGVRPLGVLSRLAKLWASTKFC